MSAIKLIPYFKNDKSNDNEINENIMIQSFSLKKDRSLGLSVATGSDTLLAQVEDIITIDFLSVKIHLVTQVFLNFLKVESLVKHFHLKEVSTVKLKYTRNAD